MFNNLSIKQKLIIFTAVIVFFIIIASQAILYSTTVLNESFVFYKDKAVKGKIAVLKIAKDLNYISRSTRDIMLDNNYTKNIKIIENSIKKIEINFEKLVDSIKDTPNSEKKLKICDKSRRATLMFINDALEKMKTLEGKNGVEKYNMYQVYKTESTPVAMASRKYFTQLSDFKSKGFEESTEKFHYDMKQQRDFIAITTVIMIFVIISLMLMALKTLIKHLKTEQNLKDTENLLFQYKEAIDITNIVSKTDKKGLITYVNDEFCKVSQYSKKELIGQPHNIVRSKDVPKNTFKELWNTLKSKKPWNGVIQNRKKDGTHYFVDTTILPILDNNNDVQEYIAIRKNITDIIELNLELVKSQEEILNRMGMIAETRSKETGHHVKRVAEYCKIIAIALNLEKKDIELLYNASALHDIGKVGTPDGILHKPGKLTDEEFNEMKKHTLNGYEMLKDSDNEIVKTGALIAYQHHEKYDGTGYPNKLKGDDIDIFARITAIADVFDALGEKRSYKQAWSLNEIIQHIKDQSGKHFDPIIVEAFNKNIHQIIYIRKKYKNINL
ncbi:MAG: HD domain-containing protein [Campylobacterota bacterium]|nr:HD domain-containing protein [Campylobacterota bacterium]